MRVRLIKKLTIINYTSNNAQSRNGMDEWLRQIRRSDWKTLEDILERFASADLLGNGTNRIVFDIGGNRYRIICQYFFGNKRVRLYVRWIGTHTHYTKLCTENRQYTIRSF